MSDPQIGTKKSPEASGQELCLARPSRQYSAYSTIQPQCGADSVSGSCLKFSLTLGGLNPPFAKLPQVPCASMKGTHYSTCP